MTDDGLTTRHILAGGGGLAAPPPLKPVATRQWTCHPASPDGSRAFLFSLRTSSEPATRTSVNDLANGPSSEGQVPGCHPGLRSQGRRDGAAAASRPLKPSAPGMVFRLEVSMQ